MKIVCISDTHGFLPELPSGDLLLIAGDICPTINHRVDFQIGWLETRFKYWLNNLDYRRIIYCAGNHDFAFEKGFRLPDTSKYKYLQDDYTYYQDIKIWGSPWQLPYYDWSFNATEDELAIKYKRIPFDIDIIVSHGPPLGRGDITIHNGRVGSQEFLKRIEETEVKLVVTGHCHSGYGIHTHQGKLVVNAALLNEEYELVKPPIELEWEDIEEFWKGTDYGKSFTGN